MSGKPNLNLSDRLLLWHLIKANHLLEDLDEVIDVYTQARPEGRSVALQQALRASWYRLGSPRQEKQAGHDHGDHAHHCGHCDAPDLPPVRVRRLPRRQSAG